MGKYLPQSEGYPTDGSSLVTKSDGKATGQSEGLPYEHVRALLDTMDKGMLLVDRDGQVLLTNTRARKCLEEQGKSEQTSFNFFAEMLEVDVQGNCCSGSKWASSEIELKGTHGAVKPYRARVKWIPESEWLAIEISRGEKTRTGIGGKHADYGSGITAGTRDHLPKFACRVFEVAGSEPAKDGFSGFRGA